MPEKSGKLPGEKNYFMSINHLSVKGTNEVLEQECFRR